MTLTSFRQNFPEFANATIYPDAVANYWMGISAKLVNADRWGEMTDHGISLLTAHFLSMAIRNQSGQAGNAGMGAVSSKTVDKVSISYDAGMGSVEGAGAYNSTSYGRSYAHFANMFGAGGVQL